MFLLFFVILNICYNSQVFPYLTLHCSVANIYLRSCSMMLVVEYVIV